MTTMTNGLMKMKEVIKPRKFLTSVLIIFSFALCFVWPIPNNQLPFHRNGFIYPIIFIAIGIFFRSPLIRQKIDLNKIKFVLVTVWVLTAFLVINGLYVAENTGEMLSYWNGQWVRPVLLFCSGLIIVPVIQDQYPAFSASKFLTLVILFFWGVVCLHLLDSLWLYWRDGVIHWGETRITFNRTRMSYQINMITGFILAELISRGLLRQRFLHIRTSLLLVILASNLLCTALVDTRWGTIGLVGSLFSTFILISLHSKDKSRLRVTGSILVGLVMATLLLALASWKTDPRWQNLESDAVTGWNAPFTSFCYNRTDGTVPVNSMGEPMNHSNGCRASFFHQGWKLVGEHPAGTGPMKEAFKYVLQRDTADTRINIPHSHYGLIEFGIQNGIAGIVGWLILLAGCWYIGWKAFRHGQTMPGMFLLIFTVGFFSRTLVDHNLLDHYLEQYMMLTGLLIGICSLKVPETEKIKTS